MGRVVSHMVIVDKDYQARREKVAEEVRAEHRSKPWWVRVVERLLGIPESCIENRVAFRSPEGSK